MKKYILIATLLFSNAALAIEDSPGLRQFLKRDTRATECSTAREMLIADIESDSRENGNLEAQGVLPDSPRRSYLANRIATKRERLTTLNCQ